MRAFKIILYSVGALVVLALIGAVVLYSLASATPKAYLPARMSPDERSVASKRFFRAVQQLHNEAEDVLPFTVIVTQDQINSYLASMDEIVAFLPGRQAGEVSVHMQEADISEPAVAISQDGITLMVRATEYDKVVSVTIMPQLSADGRLAVRTAGATIGRLSVPDWMLRRFVEVMRRRLPTSDATSGGGKRSQADDVGTAISTVLRAVDGEPIEPICGFYKDRRIRLAGLKLRNGSMEMEFEPYGRKVTTRLLDD